MKTIEIQLFKFDELSKNAKEKAIEYYRQNCHDFDWYECIYDDAKNVGIQIKSFDMYRKEIEIDFYNSFEDTAYKILDEHTETCTCNTYKIAKCFLENKTNLVAKYSDGLNLEYVLEDNFEQYDEEIEEIEQDFKNDLANEYLSILINSYEYQQSDEFIVECIQANEYDFTEDGKMY